MTPTPSRSTTAGVVYNDLRNHASRNKKDPASYFTFYVLEGFLARLARSQYINDFVLKGGMLLAAYSLRRPTRDIDLSVSNLSNELDVVMEAVKNILLVSCDDGIIFKTDGLRAEVIRDDDDYHGVRVSVVASISKAVIPFHIDINFGDPIFPAPQRISVERILGGEISIFGYPEQMVVAEKIVTAFDRGAANTRWRDFYDVLAISRTKHLQSEELLLAIHEVARFRGIDLGQLSDLAAGLALAGQSKWISWIRKQKLADAPASLIEVIQELSRFIDPVLARTVEGQTWDPVRAAWV